ncbi:GNAT family N-acetyltransferase [Streptomyces sp. NPDC001933]|uniref:GNAT family N-acetyltransferase n=1 Tax=Streptomyces sp. NPDC001933 TaxID=3364626 RepID=UPI0036BDA107
MSPCPEHGSRRRRPAQYAPLGPEPRARRVRARARQEADWAEQVITGGTFLVAWSDGTPVGTAQILWRGCKAAEVHERFPECPELNGLGVWPPHRRSQGIGTAIVRAAESRVRRNGYQQIGLGVDDQNHRAASLYLRLGYQETGCRYLDRYHYLDDDGVRHEVADPGRFLIKQLTGQPS